MLRFGNEPSTNGDLIVDGTTRPQTTKLLLNWDIISEIKRQMWCLISVIGRMYVCMYVCMG